MNDESQLPLAGVRVLDLSTLLPGPLASLILAEAGADVVKIERPGLGDEMRSYVPKFGESSANFAILNRGKRAFAVDLKDPAQRDQVLELAREADIILEQFRPGVLARLGLGYDDIKAVNPSVIFCSITGYGQEGPRAVQAGHDLNYLAESGLLNTVVDATGKPALPVTVIADIAGGTYPAVVNILLALRKRENAGVGSRISISMAHNLQTLGYGYFASHQASGHWPTPGKELLTGGSPRYQIYTTADGRHIACAALEEKFWVRLLELMNLQHVTDDAGRETEVIQTLAARFAEESAEFWGDLFAGEDVCTVVVATYPEAVSSGLVEIDSADRVVYAGESVSTLPSVVSPSLRRNGEVLEYPALVELPAELWRTPHSTGDISHLSSEEHS